MVFKVLFVVRGAAPPAQECTPYRMYGGLRVRCFAQSAKLVIKNIQGSIFLIGLRVFLLRKKLVRCVLGELPVRRDQRGHPFGIPLKSIYPCMPLIIEFAMQTRAIVLGGHPVRFRLRGLPYAVTPAYLMR